MKMYLVYTTKRKVILIATNSVVAEDIFKRFFPNEAMKSIRKLKVTDFLDRDESILVLPNREFI